MNQPVGNAQLEIGHVISRTFAAVAANFPTFLVLAILFSGVPAVLVGYLTQMILLPAVMSTGDVQSYLGSVYLVQIIGGLLMMLPAYVLVGALTHGAVVFLAGDRASLAACLATGFSRSLPLLALGLLTTLGMMFFLLLLIIPGIMAATRWSVAGPSLVVERTGIFGAFSRSADLTRGNRWRIFWLFVVWAVASYVFQLCIEAVFRFTFDASNMLGEYAVWVYFAIIGVSSAVTSMLAAAGSAALYSELREIKDGATSAELAKVFD